MYRACEVYAMDKRTKVSALCTQRRWQLYTESLGIEWINARRLPVTDPDHSSPDSIIPTIPERLFAIDPGTY